MPSKDVFEASMVYIREKLSDVALQDPSGSRIVARDLAPEFGKALKCPMRSFAFAAGIRIMYESGMEIPIQCLIEKVVHNPVPDRRLMNIAPFRIGDDECVIAAVPITARTKFSFQNQKIIHEPHFKSRHVFMSAFTFRKCAPRGKKRVH